MRVGMVIGGFFLVALGLLLQFTFLSFPLLVIGVLLLLLGLILPKPGAAVNERLDSVEARLSAIEGYLRTIGEKVGLPPPQWPSREPVSLVPPWAPPPEAPQPVLQPPPVEAPAARAPIPSPAPPPPSPPTSPPPYAPEARAPAAPSGVSRLEQQIGERWFLWIGLVVLTIAFAFFLAIVLPQLTPPQIVAVVLASAAGLVLLGEYVFARKGLREYAKALEAGAFGIAYIGVWGGGFFFRLPGFPWEVALAATLGFHAAAALRYSSPLLSVEVGLVFIAWVTWLRSASALAPADLAVLLSAGSVGLVGLALAQREARAVLALTFAFGLATIGSAELLVPTGFVPTLVVGAVAAVVSALGRQGRFISVPPTYALGAWCVAIGLAYGALLANGFVLRIRGAHDDIAVFGTFVGITIAFAAAEMLLRDRGRLSVLATLVAPLGFPVPFLMLRGEFAMIVYPALLLSLALLRRTRGLAWHPNVMYLSLLLFAINPPAPDVQFAAAWIVFFGVASLHLFLQFRSGYPSGLGQAAVEVPVLFLAVGLVGFTAQGIPGPSAIMIHGVAMAVAILLNHRGLRGAPETMGATVAGVVLAAALARWWSLAYVVTGFESAAGPLLAAYHVAVFAVLGSWVVYRKVVSSYVVGPGDADRLRVSLPGLALLVGLLAQGPEDVVVFAALPPLVAVVGYLLDDGVTFNAAFVAASVQTTAAAALFVESPTDAMPILLLFATALMAAGFSLELGSSRRVLARLSETTSSLMWFPVAPFVFGVHAETTAVWTVVGVVAVAWGLWRKFPQLRYLGFAHFFAVLGKVSLYDIAGLELSVRVFALVIVAGALLGISYGYARYRRKHAAVG
jgi:hypothetical protein